MPALGLDDLIASLDLPAGSRVGRRIPKKLLLENGASTAADRRRIKEGIEELRWVAALKPTTIAVPEYRDDAREYLEISVLRLILRAKARATRIVELVHRTVPYPVLLIRGLGLSVGVSAAHLRWSQGQTGKTVLDGDIVSVEWDVAAANPCQPPFAEALALGCQPCSSLHALYQGWIDTLLAYQAARLTGAYTRAESFEKAAARCAALQECAVLDREISRLRAAAGKERQMSRQVEINLELKRLEVARAEALARM